MIEGFQKPNARISKDTEIRVHINICSPVRMHVCISPSSKDMVIRACARNIIHVYTRIYMHTCTHACKHAYIHAYMSTCIHTCIRMKFVFPGSPTQGHHSIQAHLRLTGLTYARSPYALRTMASSTKAPRSCTMPPRKLEAWAALARSSHLCMA